MLDDFLRQAIELNADSLEIEYKDRKEWLTAFRGNLGFGIGAVDSEESDVLFDELKGLKRSKRVIVSGVTYCLSFSSYDSFGEQVQRIRWKPDKRPGRSN
jgi:hypothetical protein